MAFLSTDLCYKVTLFLVPKVYESVFRTSDYKALIDSSKVTLYQVYLLLMSLEFLDYFLSIQIIHLYSWLFKAHITEQEPSVFA